ncbi:hypothetical protein DBR47_10530 [Paucibacter sp. KBW04]|uniref:hypothetical protein n=1 Tax=Paucibacter sp. KBW04 TaxID=2153361 RepID=UPI000F574D0B|nr:hypothetical protein [Paucibacter sp. KBW04]RQO59807.1 hypothetical protein DBR47_10530 [Paucibacter sp. KBW04]
MPKHLLSSLGLILLFTAGPSAAQGEAAAAADVAQRLRQATPSVQPYTAEEIARRHAGKGLSDCFWTGTLKSDTFNILSPDLGVVYWIAQFKLPVGASLSLEGEFPHARYLSFASYNPMGQPVDSLSDLLIRPAPGSSNPFLPGADRQAKQRQYTVALQPRDLQAGQRVDEAQRPPNTLFMPDEAGVYQLWMRVYVPDQGRDVKGGVALPRPQLRLASGHRLDGEALCRAIGVPEAAVRDYRSTAEGNRALFKIPGARAPYHPAQPAPVSWNSFFNPLHTLSNVLINTPFEGMRSRIDASRRSGFYGTLDNSYMTTYLDDRYGQTLLLRGKAPRTAVTWRGGPKMTGELDMRYWSLCKGRSIADGAVDACLFDEQVPLNEQGRYNIVVSSPAHRPANARAECGVAWLPWGEGDGIGNPHGGYLIFRHLLPSPAFAHSLAKVQKPGEERQVLGDYYPDLAYQDKAAFEARGCPAR